MTRTIACTCRIPAFACGAAILAVLSLDRALRVAPSRQPDDDAERYTVRVNTFERSALLPRVVQHWASCPRALEVHVVWSEPAPPPAARALLPGGGGGAAPRVVVERHANTSLNNRFALASRALALARSSPSTTTCSSPAPTSSARSTCGAPRRRASAARRCRRWSRRCARRWACVRGRPRGSTWCSRRPRSRAPARTPAAWRARRRAAAISRSRFRLPPLGRARRRAGGVGTRSGARARVARALDRPGTSLHHEDRVRARAGRARGEMQLATRVGTRLGGALAYRVPPVVPAVPRKRDTTQAHDHARGADAASPSALDSRWAFSDARRSPGCSASSIFSPAVRFESRRRSRGAITRRFATGSLMSNFCMSRSRERRRPLVPRFVQRIRHHLVLQQIVGFRPRHRESSSPCLRRL